MSPRELTLLPAAIAAYVREHTTSEAPLFADLREETLATLKSPQMQVGPVEGALLRLLVQLSGARSILEIGTFSGYSGLAMASALPDGGALITCDVDPVVTAVARRYFDQSGHGHKITIRLGPALDTIAELGARGHRFDLVFIDADKRENVEYFRWALRLTRVGGIIVIDNVVRRGLVADPDSTDANVQGTRRVLEMLAAEPRVSATAIQTVGSKGYDGFALAVVGAGEKSD